MHVLSIEPGTMTLSRIMKTGVVSIGMDATLNAALEICGEHGIRHLPVVDEEGRLVGILTDRDIRYHLSPRLGTLSENSSDRALLQKHVHVVMSRNVIVGTPDLTIAEGARRMLTHRVGCLPVVDEENKIAGLVTATDYLLLMASPEGGRT